MKGQIFSFAADIEDMRFVSSHVEKGGGFYILSYLPFL